MKVIHAIGWGMTEFLFMSFITVNSKRLNMGPLEVIGKKKMKFWHLPHPPTKFK
jgi:hypothetical protein